MLKLYIALRSYTRQFAGADSFVLLNPQ